MIKIGPTEESILREITDKITDELNRAGLFNRVFSRIKSKNSIERKIAAKKNDYVANGKKLQDIFGIRVTLYFLDDEAIAVSLIKKIFTEIPGSHSIDKPDKITFGPIRNNLVFQISQDLQEKSSLFDQDFIDSTFEVQFRTIFSEGWHEVEHDLRYKCKDDWSTEEMLSRQLNGQLAALETSDWAILKIFDEMAYKKYKIGDWNSFLRNVLRIRFEDTSLSQEQLDILNTNHDLAKEIMKTDREKLILSILTLTKKIPLKMDNVMFVLNRAFLKDEKIITLESAILKNILTESFPI